jgi:hypothetical protein
MGQILWSDRASVMLRRLAPTARAAIEKRMSYLRSMPRMYAVAGDKRFPGCRSFWIEPAYAVAGDERLPGCRSFSIEPAYCVYYMVAAGGSDCYIVAIVEAETDEAAAS